MDTPTTPLGWWRMAEREFQRGRVYYRKLGLLMEKKHLTKSEEKRARHLSSLASEFMTKVGDSIGEVHGRFLDRFNAPEKKKSSKA